MGGSQARLKRMVGNVSLFPEKILQRDDSHYEDLVDSETMKMLLEFEVEATIVRWWKLAEQQFN
jgi:hypothetical protein